MIVMSMFVLTSIFVFASDENTFSLNERGFINCYDGAVTISPETTEVLSGEKNLYVIQLENEAIEWRAVSSNENIALLSTERKPSESPMKSDTGGDNLYIKGVNSGTCTITFTRLDNNATGTITVNVLE